MNRNVEIIEDLTAIHVTYTCTHCTRYYTIIEEEEGTETDKIYGTKVSKDMGSLVVGKGPMTRSQV